MKSCAIIAVLFALSGAWMLRGQTCGSRITTPQTDLVQVICVDYDGLKKYLPFITVTGKATQVLIHAKSGDTVSVTAGGVTILAPLIRDSYGRLVALVVFPGADYAAFDVRVFTEHK